MSEFETTSFSVLVVEDDADTRDTLAEVLQEDGFAVLTASNGREAFEVLNSASTKPSVILLDMMMPVMDGWNSGRHREMIPSWHLFLSPSSRRSQTSRRQRDSSKLRRASVSRCRWMI